MRLWGHFPMIQTKFSPISRGCVHCELSRRRPDRPARPGPGPRRASSPADHRGRAEADALRSPRPLRGRGTRPAQSLGRSSTVHKYVLAITSLSRFLPHSHLTSYKAHFDWFLKMNRAVYIWVHLSILDIILRELTSFLPNRFNQTNCWQTVDIVYLVSHHGASGLLSPVSAQCRPGQAAAPVSAVCSAQSAALLGGETGDWREAAMDRQPLPTLGPTERKPIECRHQHQCCELSTKVK